MRCAPPIDQAIKRILAILQNSRYPKVLRNTAAYRLGPGRLHESPRQFECLSVRLRVDGIQHQNGMGSPKTIKANFIGFEIRWPRYFAAKAPTTFFRFVAWRTSAAACSDFIQPLQKLLNTNPSACFIAALSD